MLNLILIAYPENFQKDSDVESPDPEAPSKCCKDKGREREDEEEGGEPAQQCEDHDGLETSRAGQLSRPGSASASRPSQTSNNNFIADILNHFSGQH